MSSNKMKKEFFCKKCSIIEVAWGIFKIVSFKRRLSKLIIIFTRNFQTVWRLNMMTYGLNYKIFRMVLKYSIRINQSKHLIIHELLGKILESSGRNKCRLLENKMHADASCVEKVDRATKFQAKREKMKNWIVI